MIPTAVRKEFQFDTDIQEVAHLFLLETRLKTFPANVSRERIVFVGVHIRRGDMLNLENFKQGYTTATSAYLKNAIALFKAKFEHVVFVVCSDDLEWSETRLGGQAAHMVFSEAEEAIVDMAILSQCNHTIMTVGTFGWWGAWLAGGITIYYKDFPRMFSFLSEGFSSSDFFPENWIGLNWRGNMFSVVYMSEAPVVML